MAAKRVAVFDPTGRLLDDLAAAGERGAVQLVAVASPSALASGDFAAIVVGPAHAGDLGPAVDGGPSRWLVGDAQGAARLAGAAATAHAAGVLLAPVSGGALAAIATPETQSFDLDVARARGLIATSLVDLAGSSSDALRAVADGFAAHDCIVWWKDGAQMTPTAAREHPSSGYRTQIAAAARIAAAASGSVIVGGDTTRSVIADALRSSPTEVAGLVAIIADGGRRFTTSERTDLKAIAARLTRELSWLTSHRRLVADGERLLATSLHDPLTGAMTRGAFEQSLAHEIAAGARRKEKQSIVLFDVVGLRRINLAHGHSAGDEVLAQIAARLRATVRGNDPIGRPGGDELAILLVGAPIEQAVLVARKLILKIQSEAVRVDGHELPVAVRAVTTEIAAGERSGEAGLARCYSALRTAPAGDVTTVDSADRPNDAEPGGGGGLAAGTIIGGTYRVVHELSRGAMGVVYRGEDLGLGRPVAIKLLRADLASDRDLVERFRAEAQILAGLHHKNLVQVYTLGEHSGEVYFVMELVEGQPLSEVLRGKLEAREWFPIEAIAQIVLEIGEALDAMHAAGLIHRDVKPANVLIDRERDRAVLVDVGVAIKAGDTRDAAGTPGFAAPESFLEQEGGPSTDVYGLAATMYCVLVGRPPFGSGSAPQVVQRQLSDPLPPPSTLRAGLSDGVDAVLVKALHPQPKKRYATASAFAEALSRALLRGPSAAAVVAQPMPATETAKMAMEARSMIDQSAAIADEPPADAKDALVVGRVRSIHLRALSRLLHDQLGASAIAKIKTERPELSRSMSPTLPPLAWSDLAELVAGLAEAQRVLPNALVPRKIARSTMSVSFARLFGADPSSLPAETVLAALPTFWTKYHDWGDVEVVTHPGAADILLHGYSGSSDVCVLVGAQLERIVELTGAKAPSALHERCRCSGDDVCEFRLSWTPP